MDFEDDCLTFGSSSTTTSKSRHSPQSTISGRRRRTRGLMDLSQDSNASSDTSQTDSTGRVKVKGAGTSVWAVQDAGTFQMLQDECSYTCSTLLAAKSLPQVMEAGLDLCQMLGVRKTRNWMWNSVGNGKNDNGNDVTLDGDTKVDAKGKTNDGMDFKDVHMSSSQQPTASSDSRNHTSSVMASVLHVLAQATAPQRHQREPHLSNTSRHKSRTKSARRKRKQHTTQSTMTSRTTALHSPELAPVWALIWYYLSWDCTLNQSLSVAARQPQRARKLRHRILQEGPALQGLVGGLINRNPNIVSGEDGDNASSIASSPISRIESSQTTSSHGSAPSSPSLSLPETVPLQKEGILKRRRTRTDPLGVDSLHTIASTVSSVSFCHQEVAAKPSSAAFDPTAMGRRNRRKKRKLGQSLSTVPEDNGVRILPMNSGMSFATASIGSSKDEAFATPATPPRRTAGGSAQNSPSSHSVTTTTLPLHLMKRLKQLQSRVVVAHPPTLCEHHLDTGSMGEPGSTLEQEAWVAMVGLESLNRILQGKDDESPSCLEQEDSEDDNNGSEDDEDDNPLLATNRLLAKSGMVPHLARAMSQSIEPACLEWPNSQSKNKGCHCWKYWHDRLTLVASMVDGACLFHKQNRKSFCETDDKDDPFSLDEFDNDMTSVAETASYLSCSSIHRPGKGLIHYILWLLHLASEDLPQDATQSGLVLLALRTLTSLTHDNAVAAEQMTLTYELESAGEHPAKQHSATSPSSSSVRGLDVLAELVIRLEREGGNHNASLSADGATKRGKKRRPCDKELHRYDSTIFCLNTLANIIEASDVRRHLAEIQVSTFAAFSDTDDEPILWLQWLCRWLVQQTASFQDAILGIGGSDFCATDDKASFGSERELQKHEEDRLVAAGNGSVLLACLMMEPEDIPEEPESTNTIRKLIMEEMPRTSDGKSTGVTMIINTLRAFCNFYHYSLGDLSVAIVAPVKKLIVELEELQKSESSS